MQPLVLLLLLLLLLVAWKCSSALYLSAGPPPPPTPLSPLSVPPQKRVLLVPMKEVRTMVQRLEELLQVSPSSEA